MRKLRVRLGDWVLANWRRRQVWDQPAAVLREERAREKGWYRLFYLLLFARGGWMLWELHLARGLPGQAVHVLLTMVQDLFVGLGGVILFVVLTFLLGGYPPHPELPSTRRRREAELALLALNDNHEEPDRT
jgi:hypothetical protein